jgi:hypothetical protein
MQVINPIYLAADQVFRSARAVTDAQDILPFISLEFVDKAFETIQKVDLLICQVICLQHPV